MTHQWDSYPKLPPTTNFPPVKLDRGFYYVNAFEPFVHIVKSIFLVIDIALLRFTSTMETETVSSRNVVDLLLREEFGTAICPPSITSEQDAAQLPVTVPHSKYSEDFVFGFDC